MHASDMSKIENILPIIMAGGRGERLSPMTDTTPKPLLQVDGTPAIVRILKTLSAIGFSRACITLGYRADNIINMLGTVCEGIALSYSVEETPHGTAGGVLLAWDTYAKKTDTDALILSGDAVFSLDLAPFLYRHRRYASAATLLCAHVEDPSPFGVVLCDADGHIKSFCEKPAWGEAKSDLVNAGIYLISRTFLATLPRGTFLDFGRDVFPHALKEGHILCAHATDGYWCDIGTPLAFLLCVTSLAGGGLLRYSPLLAPSDRLYPPQLHHSAIGPGCRISASASVWDSVLFEGVTVGKEATVTAAILCDGVSVGAHATIGVGAVIGEGAVICENTVIPPHARIAPYTTVGAVTSPKSTQKHRN